MAEVNANSLPAKTDLGTNDSAIVVDQTTNAGALVDLDVLADKVLDRLTSKTFTSQVGSLSAQTILDQLSTLNSKLNNQTELAAPEGYTGSCRYTVIGKVCIVGGIFGVGADGATADTTMFDGLPRVIENRSHFLTTDNTHNTNVDMYLNNGGTPCKLVIRNALTANASIRFGFCYITM